MANDKNGKDILLDEESATAAEEVKRSSKPEKKSKPVPERSSVPEKTSGTQSKKQRPKKEKKSDPEPETGKVRKTSLLFVIAGSFLVSLGLVMIFPDKTFIQYIVGALFALLCIVLLFRSRKSKKGGRYLLLTIPFTVAAAAVFVRADSVLLLLAFSVIIALFTAILFKKHRDHIIIAHLALMVSPVLTAWELDIFWLFRIIISVVLIVAAIFIVSFLDYKA